MNTAFQLREDVLEMNRKSKLDINFENQSIRFEYISEKPVAVKG